ncbi:MAG: SRPBCC domain-containing protein, partial [Anaerolineae bacterium]|nr:SRPBCC domain-containing protein [Anaerolineae bacterium]
MEAVQEITRSVVIHAGRERVWKALTTPEQISIWFEKFTFTKLQAGEPMVMGDHTEIGAEIAIVEP